MNIISRKLIIESPNYDLSFGILEESDTKQKKTWLEGFYLMANRKNKNNRSYPSEELDPAVKLFKEQYIHTGRAGGELNHSNSPDTDLSKLCHKIISLEQDKNDSDLYKGKSMVLSTPSGKILESLIHDGVKFGVSSKILGKIEENNGSTIIRSPIILTVDAVYDPSIGNIIGDSGFVNGILENKNYIIGNNGYIEEAFEKFEKSLSKYPSKYQDDIRQHIIESLNKFLKSI